MRYTWTISSIAALVWLTGCSIQRGTIDFANPWFDVDCGPVAIIALRDSTILHVGGTYLMLSLPLYIPIIIIVALFTGYWLLLRWRSRA